MHFTEDSNGTTVYYTILEDTADNIEDPNVLNIDNSELLGDNVFYLSVDNEQEQTCANEQDEEVEDISPTFSDPVFEEITLPDGTHAYLKNETNIGNFIYLFVVK